jgi:hypothetical protein
MIVDFLLTRKEIFTNDAVISGLDYEEAGKSSLAELLNKLQPVYMIIQSLSVTCCKHLITERDLTKRFTHNSIIPETINPLF